MSSQEQRSRELEKKLKDAEMERDIPKNHGLLQHGTEMRLQFIEKTRFSFPEKKICHVWDVFPSGYSCWRIAPLSPRRTENEKLKIGITDLFARHNRMARAGSRALPMSRTSGTRRKVPREKSMPKREPENPRPR